MGRWLGQKMVKKSDILYGWPQIHENNFNESRHLWTCLRGMVLVALFQVFSLMLKVSALL